MSISIYSSSGAVEYRLEINWILSPLNQENCVYLRRDILLSGEISIESKTCTADKGRNSRNLRKSVLRIFFFRFSEESSRGCI